MERRARGIFFLINFAGEIFLSFLPEGEGGQIGGIRVASFYFRLDKRAAKQLETATQIGKFENASFFSDRYKITKPVALVNKFSPSSIPLSLSPYVSSEISPTTSGRLIFAKTFEVQRSVSSRSPLVAIFSAIERT